MQTGHTQQQEERQQTIVTQTNKSSGLQEKRMSLQFSGPGKNEKKMRMANLETCLLASFIAFVVPFFRLKGNKNLVSLFFFFCSFKI